MTLRALLVFFMVTFLLFCVILPPPAYVESQGKGVLVENSDHTSIIHTGKPFTTFDVPPRITIEYADLGLKVDLAAPLGIDRIVDQTLAKVTVEYAEYAKIYGLQRTPASLVLPLESRIIVEYADFMSSWNFGLKPVLQDHSPPIVMSVYQEPLAEEVYPWDYVTIYANVIDDLSGVKRVILRYTIDDKEWIDVEMMKLKEDLYTTVIPKTMSNRSVVYIIIAEDNRGNAVTTKEYRYRVLPIDNINIDVKPTNFVISPSERVTLQITLTDRIGKPLSNRTIQWLLLSNPEVPEFPKVISSTTDKLGRATITYEATDVPYDIQVEVHLLLGDSQSYVVSRGKIVPSPLMEFLAIFASILISTFIFTTKRLRSAKKSQKSLFILLSFFLFIFSFLLSYPLKFHENFFLFILYAKTPFWFNVSLLLLFVVLTLFIIFSRVLKLGIILGTCCWVGIICGLTLPYMRWPSKDCLVDFLIATASPSSALMLAWLLSGPIIAYVLGRATLRRPPPLGPVRRPQPKPLSSPRPSTPPKPLLLPTVQHEEYVKCFQNPHRILDKEIRNGEVVKDPIFGTPKMATGNFGCVFKVNCRNKTYAVKCWTKFKERMQERYKKISKYLKKVNLPYFITFDYVDKGIMLTDGRKVPILKMEWVEGKRLDTFIEENINNSAVLKKLAEKIIDCIIDLQRKRIAHGDLCPENIIIVPTTTTSVETDFKIVLIDYDCLYIPAFSGEEAPELGHDNYQHPKRGREHYNERLDNFSALIMYLSLLALASEPDLWDEYHQGEDYLIIKRTDLENPQNSKVIMRLKESKSNKVRKLTELLLEALNEDPLSEKISPEKIKSIPD